MGTRPPQGPVVSRPPRITIGGEIYHVLSRGNGKARVFHREADYEAMLRLIGQACRRVPVRVLGYCLMPNHFHAVVSPRRDGDLSRWVQWLLTTHVRRVHRIHAGSGHVWQGRFKSFVVQDDAHLFAVLRYVERNPLRAGLATCGEDWPWSSARWWRAAERPAWLEEGPVRRNAGWLEQVNGDALAEDLDGIRHSIRRGAPYGSRSWSRAAATRHGCESTLRSLGRPRPRSESKPVGKEA